MYTARIVSRGAAEGALCAACEVGRGSGKSLHVDTPLGGIKPENFHGAGVAEPAEQTSECVVHQEHTE